MSKSLAEYIAPFFDLPSEVVKVNLGDEETAYEWLGDLTIEGRRVSPHMFNLKFTDFYQTIQEWSKTVKEAEGIEVAPLHFFIEVMQNYPTLYTKLMEGRHGGTVHHRFTSTLFRRKSNGEVSISINPTIRNGKIINNYVIERSIEDTEGVVKHFDPYNKWPSKKGEKSKRTIYVESSHGRGQCPVGVYIGWQGGMMLYYISRLENADHGYLPLVRRIADDS